jgi:titin
VRFSNTARSAGWIQTSFNNQNSPSTFFLTGSQEHVPVAPTVTTDSSSLVEETTATVNGTLTNNGYEDCQYQFIYGTTFGGPYPNDTGWSAGNITTGQVFSANLTLLSQGTKYYFKAQVKNSTGTVSGAELDFLTKPEAPTAFSAVPISVSQIDLSWTTGIGAGNTIILRKTGSYSANMSDGTQIYFNSGTTFSDTPLSANTTYYYTAWSEKSGSTQYSDASATASATTSAIGSPTVTTDSSSLVEETTATVNGTLTDNGGEDCQYRFEWGTTPTGPYTSNTSWSVGTITTWDIFSANLTGLSQGTKYYFRAQVKNSSGTVDGAELNFLTKPEAPTAFTATPISVSQIDLAWTQGTGAGNTVILRKTGGYSDNMSDGTQIYFNSGATFSDTPLSANTTYYYTAWSEKSGSTQYSDASATATATTNAIVAPTVTTNAASAVEEEIATLSGTLTNNGGEDCQWAFDWGTTFGGPYPNSTGWSAGNITTGATFTFPLIGLIKGQPYYYIAKVKNTTDTTLGLGVHFLTKPDPPSAFTATTISSSQIDLSWTSPVSAQRTKVLRKTSGYPANPGDGDVVYFGVGTSTSDTPLSGNTTYYYCAWSEVTGSQAFSNAIVAAFATTNAGPPAVIGGKVFTVNKTMLLVPWLLLVTAFSLVTFLFVQYRRKKTP